MLSEMALFGGQSCHEKEWPAWPRAGMMAQRALLNTLHSDCWTVTARSRTQMTEERRFGEAFAEYVNRSFGVPCSSGTAALTIALQALEVGPGDEVIVPGLTWVACASAVVNVGAKPVLVDVSPDTLCMDAVIVEQSITKSTKVVMAVHMYSFRSDVAKLEEICERNNLQLLEDASQAHGGRLKGGMIGSFGKISVFSFQQTKLLTSGEGGIAVTDDPILYDRLQQLRADGRIYCGRQLGGGYFDLAESGTILGRNLCLSEFQAAILSEGLLRLDRENDQRQTMHRRLAAGLQNINGMTVISDELEPAEGATFYKIPIQFSDNAFLTLGPGKIAHILSAELNLPIEPLDRPLCDNPLYQPLTSRLVIGQSAEPECFDPTRFPLPEAMRVWSSCIALPHHCLLGSDREIASIITALQKLELNKEQLLTQIHEWPQ